jgi:hypothetical protein
MLKYNLQVHKYNVERDLCGVFIVVNIPYRGQIESLFHLKIRNRLCSVTMSQWRGGRGGGRSQSLHNIQHEKLLYTI